MSDRYDVIVIGGGTAGLVTASGCARLGRHVALIEREALGGDCLWTGCVPTKALVASAKLAHQVANANVFGYEPATLVADPKRILESMRAARKLIEPHDAPEKFEKLGIEIINGNAEFVSASEVRVNERTLTAKDIVIATGSRTAVPPIPGLVDAGFIDHASFLAGDRFPSSVIILGGGYIGIEFAQILRRFGSEVTVVEMLDAITPREDHDVIAAVRAMLESEGVHVLTRSRATAVKRQGQKKVVSIQMKEGTTEIAADDIFVAAGRRGNTENIGLDRAGVVLTGGYIRVDENLRTNVPHIWACGDVHGGLQFTHVAAYEAVKLVRNMLFPGRSAVSYDNIPWALFTDPEVAHLGLTQHEAETKFGSEDVKTYKVAMHDVDRAVVDRTTTGFLKLVTDKSGTILGAHAMCSSASTLIEAIALARANKVKIAGLAQVVSPYPSLADAIGKIGALYYQEIGRSWIGNVARKIVSIAH